MMWKHGYLSCFASCMTLILGCGGGGNSSNNNSTTPKATINISPIDINGTSPVTFVKVGGTRQFTATVTGITNQTVTWSNLESPTQWAIDQSGLVKAPGYPPSGYYIQGDDIVAMAADGTKSTRYLESSPDLTLSLTFLQPTSQGLPVDVSILQDASNGRTNGAEYLKSYTLISTVNTNISSVIPPTSPAITPTQFVIATPASGQSCTLSLRYYAFDGSIYDVTGSYTAP